MIWKAERQRLRFSIQWFTPQIPATVGTWPGQGQEPGIQSVSPTSKDPTTWAGIHYRRGVYYRKQGLEAELTQDAGILSSILVIVPIFFMFLPKDVCIIKYVALYSFKILSIISNICLFIVTKLKLIFLLLTSWWICPDTLWNNNDLATIKP